MLDKPQAILLKTSDFPFDILKENQTFFYGFFFYNISFVF